MHGTRCVTGVDLLLPPPATCSLTTSVPLPIPSAVLNTSYGVWRLCWCIRGVSFSTGLRQLNCAPAGGVVGGFARYDLLIPVFIRDPLATQVRTVYAPLPTSQRCSHAGRSRHHHRLSDSAVLNPISRQSRRSGETRSTSTPPVSHVWRLRARTMAG